MVYWQNIGGKFGMLRDFCKAQKLEPKPSVFYFQKLSVNLAPGMLTLTLHGKPFSISLVRRLSQGQTVN